MKNILKIIRIAKPLYPLLSIISLLILSSAVLGLIAPVLSKYIVDEIVLQIQAKEGDLQRLIIIIIIAFGANFLGLITNSVSDRLGDHFGGKIRKFLTEKFYDKVLRLPQSYFDSKISGKIVNQLNRGINTIHEVLNNSTNFILPTFFQGIFTVAVLAFYNIPIALFTFILFPIYLILSYYSTVKWGKKK